MLPIKASKPLDLQERLAFMQLDAATCEQIRQLKSVVTREIPVALDRFYDQVRATAALRDFFAAEADIGRAELRSAIGTRSVPAGSTNPIQRMLRWSSTRPTAIRTSIPQTGRNFEGIPCNRSQ